jgi:NAD(P)-dependent dehydrogenase (short-subunit alcohol dehydrogenase family)
MNNSEPCVIIFEKNIELPTDINGTFSVLADFSNLTNWDPGIARVQKLTAGELKIGTEFEVIAEFFLQKVPMKYTLIEYELNKKVSYRGDAETVTAIDTMEFLPNQNGCLVKYKATFEFKGILAMLEPLMKMILQNTANNAYAGMRRAFSLPSKIESEISNQLSYKFILPLIYDFSKLGYNSAKKNFKAITANLSTKTAIVTGASSGIGLEAALKLANRQATVILVGRNEKKLESAKEKIISESGNKNISFEIADLSLMKETKSLADRILKKFDSIDILINNAGALFNSREVTEEGYEKSIALLLYSPCLLTKLLLPNLKKAREGSRIVNVSSGGMYTQKLDLEDLESKKNYNGAVAYAKAKRGLVIMSEYWARVFQADKISSFCMHPGWADTEAVRDSLPRFYTMTKFILRTPEQGADTIYWLAASDELKKSTGGFYLDRKIQPTHVFFTENSEEEEQNFLEYMNSFLEKWAK